MGSHRKCKVLSQINEMDFKIRSYLTKLDHFIKLLTHHLKKLKGSSHRITGLSKQNFLLHYWLYQSTGNVITRPVMQ